MNAIGQLIWISHHRPISDARPEWTSLEVNSKGPLVGRHGGYPSKRCLGTRSKQTLQSESLQDPMWSDMSG